MHTHGTRHTAVIGGGYSGILVALHLATLSEHRVTLYEKNPTLLTESSFIAGHFHLGPFYAPQPEAARQCLLSAIEFKSKFPDAAVKREVIHAVKKENSFNLEKQRKHMEWLVHEIRKLNPEDISDVDFFLVVSVRDLIRLRDGEISDLGTKSSLEHAARFFAKNSSLEGIEGVILTWEFVFNTSVLAAKLKEEINKSGVHIHLNSTVTNIHHLGAAQGWELDVMTGKERRKMRSNTVVCCAGCWGHNFDLQAGINRKWTVSIREMALIELPQRPVTEDKNDNDYFRNYTPIVYYLDQTSSTSDRIAIIPDPISRRAKLYAGRNEGYVETFNEQSIPTFSDSKLSLPLPTKNSTSGLSTSLIPLLQPNSWSKPLTPEEFAEAERQLRRGMEVFPGLLGGSKVLGMCYGTTVIVDSKNAMSRSLTPVETDGRGYFSVILPKATYAVTQGREVANIILQHYQSRISKL